MGVRVCCYKFARPWHLYAVGKKLYAEMKNEITLSQLAPIHFHPQPAIYSYILNGVTFTFAIHQNGAIKNMYEFWTGPASTDLFMNISVRLKATMYHIEFRVRRLFASLCIWYNRMEREEHEKSSECTSRWYAPNAEVSMRSGRHCKQQRKTFWPTFRHFSASRPFSLLCNISFNLNETCVRRAIGHFSDN